MQQDDQIQNARDIKSRAQVTLAQLVEGNKPTPRYSFEELADPEKMSKGNQGEAAKKKTLIQAIQTSSMNRAGFKRTIARVNPKKLGAHIRNKIGARTRPNNSQIHGPQDIAQDQINRRNIEDEIKMITKGIINNQNGPSLRKYIRRYLKIVKISGQLKKWNCSFLLSYTILTAYSIYHQYQAYIENAREFSREEYCNLNEELSIFAKSIQSLSKDRNKFIRQTNRIIPGIRQTFDECMALLDGEFTGLELKRIYNKILPKIQPYLFRQYPEHAQLYRALSYHGLPIGRRQKHLQTPNVNEFKSAFLRFRYLGPKIIPSPYDRQSFLDDWRPLIKINEKETLQPIYLRRPWEIYCPYSIQKAFKERNYPQVKIQERQVHFISQAEEEINLEAGGQFIVKVNHNHGSVFLFHKKHFQKIEFGAEKRLNGYIHKLMLKGPFRRMSIFIVGILLPDQKKPKLSQKEIDKNLRMLDGISDYLIEEMNQHYKQLSFSIISQNSDWDQILKQVRSSMAKQDQLISVSLTFIDKLMRGNVIYYCSIIFLMKLKIVILECLKYFHSHNYLQEAGMTINFLLDIDGKIDHFCFSSNIPLQYCQQWLKDTTISPQDLQYYRYEDLSELNTLTSYYYPNQYKEMSFTISDCFHIIERKCNNMSSFTNQGFKEKMNEECEQIERILSNITEIGREQRDMNSCITGICNEQEE